MIFCEREWLHRRVDALNVERVLEVDGGRHELRVGEVELQARLSDLRLVVDGCQVEISELRYIMAWILDPP